MNQRKSLTLNGLTIPHALFLINSIAMFGVSLYLTVYFFDSHFPATLKGAASFCDISSFWNCDSATFSPFSNILGVPVSFLGLLVSTFFIIGSIFPVDSLERTNRFVALMNLAGCLVLFCYSVFVLGSLCPLCTVYYALSAIAFFMLWKYGLDDWSPSLSVLGIMGIVTIAASVGIGAYHNYKEEKQVAVNKQIIQQFFNLPSTYVPEVQSQYLIHKAPVQGEAPIQIQIFSDFQCPFCKLLSDQIHKLVQQYSEYVTVRYYFFPLDSSCNAAVKSSMHPLACQAAYIAACSPEKFEEVHDAIFQRQQELSTDVIKQIAEKYNVSECINNPGIKETVKELAAVGAKFNIKSTPTLFINGVKIEGSLALPQFFALFEEILKRKGIQR